jgi:hypothetical protein
MCDKAITSPTTTNLLRKPEFLSEYSRQFEHSLVLIKSLLMTWRTKTEGGQFSAERRDQLRLIVMGRNRTDFELLQSIVFSWDTKFTSPLRMEYREAQYPDG